MYEVSKGDKAQPHSCESNSTNFLTVAMETALHSFGGLDDVIPDSTLQNIHTLTPWLSS